VDGVGHIAGAFHVDEESPVQRDVVFRAGIADTGDIIGTKQSFGRGDKVR